MKQNGLPKFLGIDLADWMAFGVGVGTLLGTLAHHYNTPFPNLASMLIYFIKEMGLYLLVYAIFRVAQARNNRK